MYLKIYGRFGQFELHPKSWTQNDEIMSKVKSTLADRYAAVMEFKNGKSPWSIGKKYHMSTRTLKYLVYRYDHQGYEGLSYRKGYYHPESVKFSILQEYEQGGISKEALCLKHDIMVTTLNDWLAKYELYKKGDKFALNGSGAIHKVDNYSFHMKQRKAPPIEKSDQMYKKDTDKYAERMKDLNKMSREELCELLLDREAEVEFLKKLEALVQERERRHAIRHK